LDQKFLLGRENGQSRRVVALGGTFLVHLSRVRKLKQLSISFGTFSRLHGEV
jgi:hypothetical protein